MKIADSYARALLAAGGPMVAFDHLRGDSRPCAGHRLDPLPVQRPRMLHQMPLVSITRAV